MEKNHIFQGPARLGGALLAAVGLMAAGTASAAAPYHPGRVLIGFSDQAQVHADAALAELRAMGFQVRRQWSQSHGAVLDISRSGLDVAQAIERLNASGLVRYAEPDYEVSIVNTYPSEGPDARNLWGLHNFGQTGGTPDADIDAPEAWDYFTNTNGGVIVAVIDTGIDYNHEDLVDNVWSNPGEIPGNGIDDDGNGWVDDVHGINAITGSGDPLDNNDHGTHVSGTIGAQGNNGIGVVGVNWDVDIMGCKFLNRFGSGSTSDAVTCLNYLTDMRVNYGHNIVVSNNSWGGGGYSQALYDAIDVAGNAGIMFVAAAGNSGQNIDVSPSYPASYDLPEIVAVAATDHNDLMASFSNYGATGVDLGAPGVSILSTVIGNGYAYFSGTSMAAPHVTGTVAMLLGYFPSRTLADIKTALMAGGDPIPALSGKTVSGNRLNVFGAGKYLFRNP